MYLLVGLSKLDEPTLCFPSAITQTLVDLHRQDFSSGFFHFFAVFVSDCHPFNLGKSLHLGSLRFKYKLLSIFIFFCRDPSLQDIKLPRHKNSA